MLYIIFLPFCLFMHHTRKIYTSIEELQKDLDNWLEHYNNQRTHQGKMCCGRTPMETLLDGKKIWQEKVDMLNLI